MLLNGAKVIVQVLSHSDHKIDEQAKKDKNDGEENWVCKHLEALIIQSLAQWYHCYSLNNDDKVKGARP